MASSKIILQTTGEQDKYLTTNPNHTHFKSSYRQYTQFGKDWISFGNNNKEDYIQPNSSYYYRIEKDGDLLNNIYIRLKVKRSSGNLDDEQTALKIINSIEFLNNDQTITKMTSDFMFSYFELNYTKAEKHSLASLISFKHAAVTEKDSNGDETKYLYLPIPLWFHKDAGNAFPLWALNNPNVGINIKTDNYDSNTVLGIDLLVDFGFLNTQEKEQFTNKSLEYLVEVPEMLENVSIAQSTTSKKLNIVKTHYVRYLFWNIKDSTDKFNYIGDKISNANISFNGNPLIANAPGSFYKDVMRYMNFESNGTLFNNSQTGTIDKNNCSNIYTYSFSLNPVSKKLSGYFTTEKFDNVELEINFEGIDSNYELSVYLVKHNIIRISDGVLNILYN